MATTTWVCYLLIQIALIPLLFRWRYGRSPFAVPLLSRNRYDVIEHGYGWLIAWFTLSLVLQPTTTTNGSLGVFLVAVGSAIIAAGVYSLGPNWRIGQETKNSRCAYVTSGMYRFVRHPIYAGMVIVVCGQTTLMPGDRRAVVLLFGTALYVVIQASAESRRWREIEPIGDMHTTVMMNLDLLD